MKRKSTTKLYVFTSSNKKDDFICYVSSLSYERAKRLAYKTLCKRKHYGKSVKQIIPYC